MASIDLSSALRWRCRHLDPDGNSVSREVRFYVRNRECPEVKQTCGEHCTGVRTIEDFREMLHFASAATRNDRDRNRVANGARQPNVVTRLRPVRVHAREQDFSGTELRRLFRPRNGVEVRRISAAM